jgi:hypothetical protein
VELCGIAYPQGHDDPVKTPTESNIWMEAWMGRKTGLGEAFPLWPRACWLNARKSGPPAAKLVRSRASGSIAEGDAARGRVAASFRFLEDVR